jgi:hypothetical protein
MVNMWIEDTMTMANVLMRDINMALQIKHKGISTRYEKLSTANQISYQVQLAFGFRDHG